MTTPYYTDERAVLHHGDCLDVLAAMPTHPSTSGNRNIQ